MQHYIHKYRFSQVATTIEAYQQLQMEWAKISYNGQICSPLLFVHGASWPS